MEPGTAADGRRSGKWLEKSDGYVINYFGGTVDTVVD